LQIAAKPMQIAMWLLLTAYMSRNVSVKHRKKESASKC